MRTLKKSRSHSKKHIHKSKSLSNRPKPKSKSLKKSKTKARPKSLSNRPKSHTKTGGGKKRKELKTKTYSILTDNGQNIPLVCNVCKNNIFYTRLSKLPTGSRIKEFFFGEFGELFESRTRLFKCINCSNILWFSKNTQVI